MNFQNWINKSINVVQSSKLSSTTPATIFNFQNCLNNSNKPTISYQGITKYACHADDNNKSKCLWSQRITNGREKFYRLSVCFHWFKPNLDTSEIKRKLGAAGLFVLDKLSFNDRTVVVLNTEQIPRNPWVHQKALGQGCRQILNLMFIY